MSYPKDKKFNVRMNIFDGGLATKIQLSDLTLNQSPDLCNVDFSTVGYIQSSRGFARINSTAIASYPIDGLAVHKASAAATEYMILACNGSLYRMTESGVASAITQGTGILTQGYDVKFTHYKNALYFSDGIATGYKYDGTSVYQAGIHAISGNAAIVSGTTSTVTFVTGTYNYGITGVSSQSQENGFTYIGSFTLSVADKKIELSNIPVYPASAGVATRNIYRKNPSGTIYYYIDSLANNTTTVYSDDKALSTTNLPADLGTMPKFKYMVEYNGYLYAAGDSDYPTRLYYTEPGYPEYWPPANYREIGGDDGYPISSLQLYNGTVIIHKNDGNGNGSIYILDVSDPTITPTYAKLVKTNAQLSTNSDKAVTGHDNQQLFFNKKGVYNFVSNVLAENPQYSAIGSFYVNSLSWIIEPNIKLFDKDLLSKIAMFEYENRVFLSAPVDAGYNNTLYIYDHSTMSTINKGTGCWTKRSDHSINNFINYKGNLYGGSSVDGLIYRLDNPDLHNHDGTAVESYYCTPFIYGAQGHIYNTKTWRYIDIGLVMTGNYQLYISYRGDPNDDWTTTSVSLNETGYLWDSAYWETAYWSSEFTRLYKRIVIGNITSPGIQFKFSTNELGAYFIIYDISVYYNLRGKRGS